MTIIVGLFTAAYMIPQIFKALKVVKEVKPPSALTNKEAEKIAGARKGLVDNDSALNLESYKDELPYLADLRNVHVQMHHPDALRRYLGDLIAQICEIRTQNRRHNLQRSRLW